MNLLRQSTRRGANKENGGRSSGVDALADIVDGCTG